jgi:hypothetical protein
MKEDSMKNVEACKRAELRVCKEMAVLSKRIHRLLVKRVARILLFPRRWMYLQTVCKL